MIQIRWECNNCRITITRSVLFDYYKIHDRDCEPPKGWGTCVEKDILLCKKCIKKRFKKEINKNKDIDSVLMA